MTENEFGDLQRRVERAHRAIPGAYEPAADIWQRAKSYAVPTHTREEEDMEMNLSSTLSNPATPIQVIARSSRKVVNQFTNVIATLAVVAIIAFGGWFAAVNLQPGDGSKQLAMIPATLDSNETCSIPALTADDALAIIKNPFSAIHPDPDFRDESGLYELLSESYDQAIPTRLEMSQFIVQHPRNEITQEDWYDAMEIGNQYLACVRYGTFGQVMALTDPFIVQQYLRDHLPLFVTEDEARALLEDMLQGDASEFGWEDEDDKAFVSDKVVQINPDFELIYADSTVMSRNMFYTDVIGAPVLFSNADGTIANAPNFTAWSTTGQGHGASYARNVILVRSVFDGHWYVVSMIYP